MSTTTVAQQIQENPELIPAIPDVAAKALKLVDEPEVKPADFEKVLSRDPGLVASMLRFANSPIYGFAHKKENIRDAIIGMGLKGLRGMLLGTTLKRFLGSQFGCYGKDPKTLWSHSMAVGTGARLLTKQLPSSPDDAEEMFVCGLLHDLGKLLIAPFLTRMKADLSNLDEPVHYVEDRLLGIHHMEAGGIVAERWNLKPIVREVVTRHHFDTCDPEFRHAIAVVRLADECAITGGHGGGQPDPHRKLRQADLDIVGLSPREWDEARVAIAEQVAATLANA